MVEDEDSVRKLLGLTLKRAGYRVLLASNGYDALDLCRHHEGWVDLLITDVVMPRMSGQELVRRLAPMYPAMKVLYLSGYPFVESISLGMLSPESPFLQKPFPIDVLAWTVHKLLEKPNHHPAEAPPQ